MKQEYDPHGQLNHPDIARLRKLARRMDNAFRLPLIGVRVGWDSILGLVPIIGDALALVPAGFIVKESHRMGAGPITLASMGVNIGIDFAIGSIPLVGDIFDIGWNANTRNVGLLHAHLLRKAATKKGGPQTAPVPET